MPSSEPSYVASARADVRYDRQTSVLTVARLLNRIDDLERRIELSESDD